MRHHIREAIRTKLKRANRSLAIFLFLLCIIECYRVSRYRIPTQLSELRCGGEAHHCLIHRCVVTARGFFRDKYPLMSFSTVVKDLARLSPKSGPPRSLDGSGDRSRGDVRTLPRGDTARSPRGMPTMDD